MSENDAVRQRIISSVFNKRSSQGLDEDYVGHLKIWEDAEDGTQKPRFILLARASNGTGVLHKSKLNTNGTFSVGKTWRLAELRGIEVLNPTTFNIILSRTYRWQTESPKDQQSFLLSCVEVSGAPLQLTGLAAPPAPGSNSRQPAINGGPPGLNGKPIGTPPGLNGASIAASTSRRSPASVSRSTTPSRDFERPPDRVPSPANSQGPRPSSRLRAAPPSDFNRSTSPPNGLPSRPNRVDATSPGPSSVRSPSPTLSQSSVRRPPGRRRPSDAHKPPSLLSTSSSGQMPALSLPATPAPRTARPSISTNNSGASMQVSSSGDSFDRSSRPSLDEPPSTTSERTQASKHGLTERSRTVSAAPSTHSRGSSRSGTARNGAPAPALPQRERNARVSFFDPANQAALDRLINTDIPPDVDESARENGDDENAEEAEMAQDTLASVEEMLEGYEWATDDMMGMIRSRGRGPADQIESRLLDELTALEKANIYSFLESDDRIGVVVNYLDKAIEEVDNMDSLLSSYKIHLNAVSDDIAYIQGQNRGLQVQTQNQRALLDALEQLLQTVNVDQDVLVILTQESLEKSTSVERLEGAAAELYKALQAGRDRDMAASMERLDEYRTYNAQFCKRVLDYLSIMFTAQSAKLLGDTNGISVPSGRGRPAILPHKDMEAYLGQYSGLMLYLKEMDESAYSKICSAYFSSISDLHSRQMKALFDAYSGMVKAEDDDDAADNTPTTAGGFRLNAGAGVRRAGTLLRGSGPGKNKDKEKGDRNLRASEAFGYILERIAPQVYQEDEFMADFLQINDAALTFADYMSLENYFRRQASANAGLSAPTLKLVRGALDLIFGFLQGGLRAWIDAALAKDPMQIFGIIATLERFFVDADERGNGFFLNVLEKQQLRLKALLDRHIGEQIKVVEDTKLNAKKRRGVAPFIRNFPAYVARVEAQLIGADALEIRQGVNMSYDKIVTAMFDCLRQMAKLDGEGEDKGQLNYHVILIENMQQFLDEISQIETGAVAGFANRAQGIYDENLGAYVKLVLRRPFGKIIDYFEGVERLLKTTAPSEVSNNSSYSKSALKKVIKEYDSKDVRKLIDTLYKRVEKHFTLEDKLPDNPPKSGGPTPRPLQTSDALPRVWKACEEEMLRITDMFAKRTAQCYEGTGVSLEYTPTDVEAACRKHRPGGS